MKHFNARTIGIVGLMGFAAGLGLILASIYLHSIVAISLAVICIVTGEGLLEPTYNGKLSQSVDESEKGKLHGVNQSLQAANNMLVPLGGATIYSELLTSRVCLRHVSATPSPQTPLPLSPQVEKGGDMICNPHIKM